MPGVPRYPPGASASAYRPRPHDMYPVYHAYAPVDGARAATAPPTHDTYEATAGAYVPPGAPSASGGAGAPGTSSASGASGASGAPGGPGGPGGPGAGPTPTVYLATYSSVPVYEITVRGIALMRRRSDGYLNATQILKIAGIEKARRTRILEKEILTGEHEKVQGGYGTFQGTWIPMQRAQELAINYSVYHLIRPLLDFDPAASKAVLAAPPPQGVKRKADAAAPPAAPAPGAAPPGVPSGVPRASRGTSQQPRFLPLRPRAEALPASAGGLVHALPTPLADEPPAASTSGVPAGSYPAQRSALGAYAAHGYVPQGVALPAAGAEPRATPDAEALDSAAPPAAADAPAAPGAPRFADKAVPPRLGDERERHARELLTGLFVQDTPSATPAPAPLERLHALLRELGFDAARATTSPLDLVIDDHGHTALHWAAALGRLPLVRMLTALPPAQGGANMFVGNYAGETALHRSVLVTNAYEQSQFPELLDLLAGSLATRDHRKRTLLHHIVLVAGLKGRAAPARYYLGCVLERLGRGGAGGAALLDAQDDEGETALSIAARLGSTHMIKLLLDAGARKDLANDLGITPLDWGICAADDAGERGAEPAAASGDKGVLSELGSYRPADVVRSLIKPPPGPVKKSQDVRERLVQTLDELQAIFEKEVAAKQGAIETTQTHLQAATRELAARRRDIAAAQAAATEREERRQRRANLDAALSHVAAAPPDAAPWTAAPIAEAQRALGADAAGAAVGEAVVRLRWLLQFGAAQCAALAADADALAQRAAARQRHYHKVVAMCAQVPPARVDGMLDELLAAVESIGSDVEMKSVANFLHKVGRAPPGAADGMPAPGAASPAPAPRP